MARNQREMFIMNKIVVDPLQPVTFSCPLKMQNSKIDTIIELPGGELIFVDSKTYDLDKIIRWYKNVNSE